MLNTFPLSRIHAETAAPNCSITSSWQVMTDENGFFAQSDADFAEEMQEVTGLVNEAEGALV
jgi:hypothetical protein